MPLSPTTMSTFQRSSSSWLLFHAGLPPSTYLDLSYNKPGARDNDHNLLTSIAHLTTHATGEALPGTRRRPHHIDRPKLALFLQCLRCIFMTLDFWLFDLPERYLTLNAGLLVAFFHSVITPSRPAPLTGPHGYPQRSHFESPSKVPPIFRYWWIQLCLSESYLITPLLQLRPPTGVSLHVLFSSCAPPHRPSFSASRSKLLDRSAFSRYQSMSSESHSKPSISSVCCLPNDFWRLANNEAYIFSGVLLAYLPWVSYHLTHLALLQPYSVLLQL